MLENKSLIELRGIAQSLSIPDVFQKDNNQLRQAIELKQREIIPLPKTEFSQPEYDSRLMTKPPSKKCTSEEAEKLLILHIERGLHFKCTEERWSMSFGKKTDEGSMRMPLKTLLYCANKIING